MLPVVLIMPFIETTFFLAQDPIQEHTLPSAVLVSLVFQSGAALQLPLTLMTWTLLQIPGQLFCRTEFEIVRFLHPQAIRGRGGAGQTYSAAGGVSWVGEKDQ